ncbi:MAG: nitrate- and nitrite sensing domain-containing protein [Flavobacteriales bacterium]|nr:nitrate- and nitrite sensing domain-containing protein [Flavobacteriales bacterium]
MAGPLHELQEENAQSIAYLGGVQVNQPRLELQYSRTDAAAERLNDPELALNQEVQSHLSLLNSTDALANVRTSLGRGFTNGWLPAGDLGWLYDQLARYSTSLFLFERDAPAEVLAAFRENYQGPDVNFVRTVIGTVQEKRSLTGLNVEAEAWKQHSDQAMAKLDDVEAISIACTGRPPMPNRRDAESRLFIVPRSSGWYPQWPSVAFIMRGIRRTVARSPEAAARSPKATLRPCR